MSEIPVHISYHRQRSSTARIRDGKILLRISNLVSRREQQRHIDELLEKMKGAWEKDQQKQKLSLRGLFDVQGSSLPTVQPGLLRLSTGVEYQVSVKKSVVSKVKVEKIGQKLIFLQPIDVGFDTELAEEVLWKFLMKDQKAVLIERLNALREGWLEESFAQLRLRQVMSRWGSCDKQRGIIMLSVKLLLVDPKMLDYVCIHELAHLRYADHSGLFWDLVAQKIPDWKVQRKKLRVVS